jgi:hypothetical protein
MSKSGEVPRDLRDLKSESFDDEWRKAEYTRELYFSMGQNMRMSR